MNSHGQLSLDVVIGLSIFIVALLFVAQYIPSIFVTENEELSLYPLVYRTSSILVEDRGYWTNGSSNGTDWENHLGYDLRIGLSSEEAGILSVEKIRALREYHTTYGYDAVRTALGLVTPVREYDYNISIQLLSPLGGEKYATDQNGGELLVIGKPLPERGEVGRYERIIAYDNLTSISPISSRLDTPSTTINTFNVSSPVGAFVIVIEDRNTNQTSSEPWMNVKVNGNLVISVSGNDTISTFDITDQINAFSGTVEVWIQAHNIRGYVIATNAGEFIGGRICAKLVVSIW